MKSTTGDAMAIVFVIHEATRTGAPRLGAQIARALSRHEPVRVIAMKDGPLTPWLRDTVGAKNLVVSPGDPFQFRVPFDERVRRASDLLEREDGDVVYVNSLASSVFALAAAAQKRRTVLHVHEKSADMFNLLASDVTKIEVLRVVDAAVLAAQDIRDDLLAVFQAAPREIETFGVAVEIETIRRAAAERVAPPLNLRGEPPRADRLRVGMCGFASARKGADIFLDVACAAPDVDFLWVGGWRPEETPENLAYEDFERRAPTNLYLAGAVDNPYPYMRMMDLFFLSSREDPNPLALAEALTLNVPVLAFSGTTAISDRLGRAAILLHGPVNVADALRALRACTVDAVRRPGFREAPQDFVADYDLDAKMNKVVQLIARLRGEPAPPAPPRLSLPTEGGRTHDLGGGVVELSFL